MAEQEILNAVARRIVEAQTVNSNNQTQFSDGKKIVLAIEGGGMRGVIEAATAAAFESIERFAELVVEHGGDCLAAREALEAEQADEASTKQHAVNGVSWADFISCVSVGAPVGSFATAKQARLRTPIFFEEMATKDFLNLPRIFGIAKREITDRNHKNDFTPPMDLDLMMKAVKDPDKGLNVEEILNSKTQIRFAVTDLDAMRSRWVDPLEQQGSKLFDLLKATCRIPGIAGKPEQGEPRFIDAMISPVTLLPENKFDYIVVFGSHPIGTTPRKKGFDIADFVTTWVSRAAMKDGNEAKRYLGFIKEQEQRNEVSVENSKKQPGRYLYFGTPPDAEEISNSTLDPAKLKRQADLAYMHTIQVLYAPVIKALEEKTSLRNAQQPTDFRAPDFWGVSEGAECQRHYIQRIKQALHSHP
ncbi:MAG: hypothetical protein PHW76_05435 [Alphaproteobacteria bacterium]|nr:hypothetical protein [Alphaproteobacteria bacterium]